MTMTNLLTFSQHTRITAWIQELAPPSPPPKRVRVPLLSTSANIRKRKRNHLDEADDQKAPPTLAPETLDPAAPSNTRGRKQKQKRGLASRRGRKITAPTQPRTTATTRSAVPVKISKKGTMADKKVTEPADLNDARRFPPRERKPSAKAREGLEAEQQQQSWEATEGYMGQSGRHPPLSHRSSAPPLPPPRTPDARSFGDPLRLDRARLQRLPSDMLSFSNADERSRPDRSPTKGVRSPSKASASTRERTRTQPKANTSLTAMDLESCTPSIVTLSVADVFALSPFNEKLPEPVDLLRLKLRKHVGFIPRVLQKQYTQEFDTPRKTQADVAEHSYQDTFATDSVYADLLRNVAKKVMKDAEFSTKAKAHERQWSATVVSFLINTLLIPYQSRTQFVDVESCAILPVELRPIRKDGGFVAAEVRSDATSLSLATEDSAPDSKTARMIDLAVGLDLSPDEKAIINEWYQEIHHGDHSLNQTLSYPRNVPLFLDIELKKPESEREAVVQLGVWQAAGFKKRSNHDWNRELMPMLGICITGHEWRCYITFPINRDPHAKVIMMDVGSMGQTRDIFGIWEIMYKLDLMLQWGTTEYKQWFDRVVMGETRAAIQRVRAWSALE